MEVAINHMVQMGTRNSGLNPSLNGSLKNLCLPIRKKLTRAKKRVRVLIGGQEFKANLQLQ